MASQSFGNVWTRTQLADIAQSADKALAAQQQVWIDALVGAKLADEATLRSLLSLDAAVVPRKRGRPAAGKGAAKAKVCDVADADRCLGCKWGGGDLDKAHCTAAADGEREDQLCSACGGNWDVVWADRKADGRVTFGPKADNPSGVPWYGFWGIDRVPVWPGEANCVHTKPGAKTSSGNGVSLAKSLDAAAGGSRKHGVWHMAREAWVTAAVDEAAPAAPAAELQADDTEVVEQAAPAAAPAAEDPCVPRVFDGLAYTTFQDADGTTHVWPQGTWLAEAGYEGSVVVDVHDLSSAVGVVDVDGDIAHTDYEVGGHHEDCGAPSSD